jgi:hypothetical protein
LIGVGYARGHFAVRCVIELDSVTGVPLAVFLVQFQGQQEIGNDPVDSVLLGNPDQPYRGVLTTTST